MDATETLDIFRKSISTESRLLHCYMRNNGDLKNIVEQVHYYALLNDSASLNLFRERAVATAPRFSHCYVRNNGDLKKIPEQIHYYVPPEDVEW
jgi:hypothetical protein